MRQLRVSTLEGDRKRKKKTYKVVNTITTLSVCVQGHRTLFAKRCPANIRGCFCKLLVNCSVKLEKQNKMEEQICIRGAVVRFEVKNKKENQSKSKKPHNFFSHTLDSKSLAGKHVQHTVVTQGQHCASVAGHNLPNQCGRMMPSPPCCLLDVSWCRVAMCYGNTNQSTPAVIIFLFCMSFLI